MEVELLEEILGLFFFTLLLFPFKNLFILIVR